jgi:predicted Rossmann fold nucleotide-binding protein DprA/Smf involved in DNA uptake
MKVAFTGTRSVIAKDEALIRKTVQSLPSDSTVITGGCLGVDTLVAKIAHELGLKVHTVMPHNRTQADPYWRTRCSTFEEMPEGTDYRDRNTRMVVLCDRLIAFPNKAEDHGASRRSGTWMTVRIARKLGKDVLVELLHP